MHVCTLFSKTVIWAVLINLCVNLNKMLITILVFSNFLPPVLFILTEASTSIVLAC